MQRQLPYPAGRQSRCGTRKRNLMPLALAAVGLIMGAVPRLAPAAEHPVLTHHYDTYRTGWNKNEIELTPSNVAGAQFGLLHQVFLDEQIDAQPLLVPNLTIKGRVHDVLYIATENNTVYAVDAANGEPPLQRSLGPPVPEAALPGGCNSNSIVVGINSTPVIDPATSTIYVMAYVNNT